MHANTGNFGIFQSFFEGGNILHKKAVNRRKVRTSDMFTNTQARFLGITFLQHHSLKTSFFFEVGCAVREYYLNVLMSD